MSRPTGWLDPLREALEGSDHLVRFFFRDDDAGWADDALVALLDVFSPHSLPLDVAAIPSATTGWTATVLATRIAQGRNDLEVHQHGFAHVSHETQGRACEFGAARDADDQAHDVARGRALLESLLGPLPTVFTPPWNRTAPWTPGVLRDLGFTVLSRDVSAGTAGVPGLAEVPVTVDWFATRKVDGVRTPVDAAGRGRLLAASAVRDGAVGVMLHHEVMAPDDLADLDALLALVADHPSATTHHLRELAA